MNINLARKLIAATTWKAAASFGLITLNLVLARTRSIEDLGIFNIAIALIVGHSVISKFGLDLVATRVVGINNGNNDRDGAGTFTWAACFAALFLSLALASLATIFLSKISGLLSLSYTHIYVCFIAGAVLSFNSTLASALRAAQSFRSGHFLDIGGFALVASMFVLASSAFSLSLTIKELILLSALTFSALGLMAIRSNFGAPSFKRLANGTRILGFNFKEASRLCLLSILQYGAQWMSILVSAAALTTQDVAYLSATQRVSMAFFFLLSVVGSTFAPKYAHMFANGNAVDIIRSERKIRLILSLTLLMPLITALTAPNLILDLLGIAGREAAHCLIILVIAQFINISCGCAPHILVAVGRGGLLLKINLATTVFLVLTMLLLSRKLDLVNIALIQGLLTASPALVSLYFSSKLLRNSCKE